MPNDATRPPERPIPAILQSIVAATRERVAHLHREPIITDPGHVASSVGRRSLATALTKRVPAIIAEIKKASPSRGVFSKDFDPGKLAKVYENGGAAAMSVVTEPKYFQGDPGWISELRRTVSLPILRKDFIIDSVQVAESASLGADAVLLIARILSAQSLAELYAAANESGLEVLFEIHDEDDLSKVLPLSPRMIGVNARNLDDFSVDTKRFHTLVPMFPPGTIAVAESGLESRKQIADLASVGFQGFLIGETLLRSDDPMRTLRQLCGEE